MVNKMIVYFCNAVDKELVMFTVREKIFLREYKQNFYFIVHFEKFQVVENSCANN